MYRYHVPPNFLKKILGSQPPAAPVEAALHITSRCTLRCEFCCYHSPLQKNRPKPHHIPSAHIIAMIKELAAMGTRTICLAGMGEPSTHPALPDIVNAVKDAGMELRILTNFSCYSPRIATAYARADHLLINLAAADEEPYLAIHAPESPETFKQVLQNIKSITPLYARKGRPFIEISYIIDKNNFRQIDKVIEFASTHKIPSIRFKLMQTTPATKGLALNKKEGRELMLSAARLIRRNTGVQTNFKDIAKELVSRNKTSASFNHCFIGWLNIVIHENGTVGFCSQNNQLVIGNWKRNSIREIWNSARAQRLRMRARDRFEPNAAFWRDCRFCLSAGSNSFMEQLLEKYAKHDR